MSELKIDIKQIWDEREDARRRYEYYAMTNCANLSADERFKIDLAYKQAEAEYMRLDSLWRGQFK